MNGIASFYIWPTDKFDQYCKIAELKPPLPFHMRIANPLAVIGTVRADYFDSPEYRKQHKNEIEQYEKCRRFIKQNAKEFLFEPAGCVILDLIAYLKETKKIDLTQETLEADGGEQTCYVMKRKFKDACFSMLDPSKFNAAQMTFWCIHREEREDDERLKSLQSRHFDDKATQQEVFKHIAEMKQWKASGQHYHSAGYGKAMVDGIRLIHNCLALVSDTALFALEYVP